MADIRLKKVTVEPSQSPLIIQKGNVEISNTTESIDTASGSLIVNGGIGINCSYNSTSITSGGSLTVGGGASIQRNLYVGENLSIDSSSSIFEIAGLSEKRLYVDSTTNKQFYVAPDGVNKRFELNDTQCKINITENSINSSTGSLVVFGGISISSTENSSSITSGGSLTVGGGSSINKKLYVGGGIDSGNANTLGNIYTTDGNVGIGTPSPQTPLHIIGNNDIISVESTDPTDRSSIKFITNGNDWELGARGSSGNPDNSFYIYNNNANQYFLTIASSGNIGLGNIIDPGVNFDVSGTIRASTSITTGSIYSTNQTSTNIVATNLSSGTLNLTSAIINNSITTANLLVTTSVSSGTLFSANGSVSNLVTTALSSGTLTVNSDIVSGGVTTGTLLATTSISSASINSLNSTITNLVITSSSIGSLDIGGITTSSLLITSGGLSASFNSNTLGNIFTTDGNVGIGTAIPNSNYKLDIRGDTRISSGNLFLTGYQNSPSNIVQTSSESGIKILTGSQSVSGSNNASIELYDSLLSSGSLLLYSGSGGVQIKSSDNTTYVKITYDNFLLENTVSMNIKNNLHTIGNIYMTGGNIGINTTQPVGKLSINSIDDRYTGIVLSGLQPGIAIGPDGKDNYILYADDGTLRLFNESRNRLDMLVTSSGNFGFGTSSPSNKIDVVGNLRITNGNLLAVGSSNTLGNLFTINDKIGIGITNPSDKLTINGTTRILDTTNALGLGSGGSLNINGGASIQKDVYIGGIVKISSTTESDDVNSGSLVLSGGLGVNGNVNVLGNTVVNGNLIVQGTTTTIETANTVLKDNIILLNSGPLGSKDSGFMIQRYQQDNDSSAGDVVNDTIYITNILGDQSGTANNEVVLGASASGVSNYYSGWWLKVSNGFSSNQVRKIVSYNGTTKRATLSSDWTTQNPSIGDTVFLYNKPFVGLVYNELYDRFEFGATVNEPSSSVEFTEKIPILFSKAICESTDISTSITAGAFILNGGITITNTTDAVSLTNGGTLLSYGGASFGKSVFIGGPILQIPTGNNVSRPSSPGKGSIRYNTETDQFEGVGLGNTWGSLFSGNIDKNVLISSTTNSTGLGTGGSLTVLGGASISKDLYVGETVQTSSDYRLKNNIRYLKNDDEEILNKIDNIRCVKFKYNDDVEDKDQIGFIAQDFIENFPELIRQSDNLGYYSLDYAKVTVILLECIKELKEEISKLKLNLDNN
jgi:hypothetical protein